MDKNGNPKPTKVITPRETIDLKPVGSVKQAFKKNEVKCLICGQGGMTVLKQHLTREHNMTPEAYKTQFGIPKGTPLVSASYHAHRREVALQWGLGKKKATPSVKKSSNYKGRVLGSKNKPKTLAHNN